MARIRSKEILAVGLSLLLLIAAAVDAAMRKIPPGADAYHQRVKKASEALPLRIGDWIGQDVPQPPAAIRLLHPNVIVSRRFVNYITGQSVTFLLVHCADARDLAGHYPPICYPNQGFTLLSRVPRDWQVDDLSLPGMEYTFARSGLEPTQVVDNFMLLPDSPVGRDMSVVDAARRDLQRRYFGAAQVQVITDPAMPQSERDQVMTMLVRANRGLIDAIRDKGTR